MMNKITRLKRITGLFLIALLTLIISCTGEITQDDLVRANAESHLQENLNDPDSYEFVELSLIDSVLIKDNIEYRIDHFQNRIENDQRMLNIVSDQERIDELNKEISDTKKVIAGIDSIKSELGDEISNVASYTYSFKYRANNEFGAMVLNDHFIQTDPAPDFEIINFAENQNQLYLDPNQFPGYRELVQRILYPDR